MVYDKAHELASLMSKSNEYREYKRTKELAMANETTRALIKEYHQLQMRAQAEAINGKPGEELLTRLQKIGEVLQFNSEASAYLMAEFALNRMLGDVYKILADAVDVDLSMFDN